MSARALVRTPALAVALLLAAPACSSGGTSEDANRLSMAWSHVEVAPDGRSAVVHAYQVGDPGCWDLVEASAEPVVGAVEVGVWYERTDQELCQLPCPLQTVPHELDWQPEWDEDRIVAPRGTPEHCAEALP